MANKAYKVSIIGAGAVGATLAQRILESGMADIVLVDVLKNMAMGKAMDLLDASFVIGHERTIEGTDDYSRIRKSDIVVITAGLARKPGMTREELIAKNAAIVKDVSEKVRPEAPSAVVIVVTNPLDAMTYLVYKTTGFDRRKVVGMAGVLDGARFIALLAAELKVPRASIETFMMGSHGDTMVPVLSHTRVSGRPVLECIEKKRLDEIVRRTRDRGAEIISLFGTGSAYYSPSAAVLRMVRAIINDTEEVFCVSACLDGEYEMRDISIGVPCRLGRNGITDVVRIELSSDEKESFLKSARAIKASIKIL